ncbi:MAG: hypothetical protein ACMUIG_08820 [Thermoplasmatota archaeon]
MRKRGIIAASLIFMILASSGVLFISFADADVIPEIFDIEKDDYAIKVDPNSGSGLIINATLKSPFREKTTFLVSAEISGEPPWSLTYPDSIQLENREQRTFLIIVTAPEGETAGKSATLDVDVEAVGGKGFYSDSCDILVLPYAWATLEPETDYLLDRPLSGAFNLTLTNDGNIPAVIGYGIRVLDDVEINFLDRTLDSGEKTVISIPYVAIDVEDTMEIAVEPIGLDGGGPAVEVTIQRDLDVVHLLFRRGPFLIIGPGLLSEEENDIRFRSIGGEIEDVGIEIIDPIQGLEVDMESIDSIGNLQRMDRILSVEGSDEDRIVMIRAYGYHDGDRIESNVIPFPVKGDPGDQSGINAVMIARGTAVGGAGLVLGFSAYLYAASEVFRYRWLTLFLIPLYAAVKKDKVLDHFFRGRLYEYIKENPGTTYTAIKKHFDVNNGTLTYHLHRLEKEELIAYRNVGKYKLFYPDGVRMRGTEIVISVLDQEILEIVSANPGITTASVIESLRGERSRRTLSRHIKDLQRKGLVDIHRDGDRRKMYLSEGWDKVILSSRGVTNMREEVTA